jgi:hypothetical protein
MATDGIWMIFKNVNKLSKEMFSLFCCYHETAWFNYYNNHINGGKSSTFQLDGKDLAMKNKTMPLFATKTCYFDINKHFITGVQ